MFTDCVTVESITTTSKIIELLVATFEVTQDADEINSQDITSASDKVEGEKFGLLVPDTTPFTVQLY
jgi:hypothetical protein